MALYEHHDFALDEFQRTHMELEDTVKHFLTRVLEFSDTYAFSRPSVDSWNSLLIQSLKRYAVRPPYIHHVDDDELIERCVWREMRSNDFAHINTVKVLIITGHFTDHENIDLLRSRFRPYEEGELHDEITFMKGMNDIDSLIQKEWTENVAYAIDPNDSEEIDDALSVVRLPDGKFKVCIHIADPTSYVPFNSRIDMKARNRGLTVYLPTCTSPMYPHNIAMELMSFRNGEKCRAVTICVLLNSDGTYESDGYSIHLSMVRVSMLTYDEADNMIHSEQREDYGSSLRSLIDAAKTRFEWRKFQINKFCGDDVPSFHNNKGRDYRSMTIKVRSVEGASILDTWNHYSCNEQSPSHFAVEEMMMLAGTLIADFGRKNGIALPYRGSNQYYYEPEPQYDLGLSKGYVRCTSPIRRYMDCLVHYQMKSHLRDQPALSTEELKKLGSGTGVGCENESKYLLRKSKLYWVIQHFRIYTGKGPIISAKLNDAGYSRKYYEPRKYYAIVFIDCDGLFEYSTTIEDVPSHVYFNRPSRVTVELEVADPHAGVLKFRLPDV